MTKKSNPMLILILTIGVFSILNTEMGVIGLLPSIAEHFDISISQAGLTVSLFAIAIAVSGPITPLLLSGINRKKVMLVVLGVFIVGNVLSVFVSNFALLLGIRVVLGLFHPVYCSMAFTAAAASVSKEEAPKAVSKVFIGVSAGMVAGVPMASFIDGIASYETAMAFFALVSCIVFAATLMIVPSMPVSEKVSYGSQLSVLKTPLIWISILTVILLNASVFGVYSYVSDYLGSVTLMSPGSISLTLFVFGAANIIGNLVAGKLLSGQAMKWVILFPTAMIAVYAALFVLGGYVLPTMLITFVWGILAGGIMANINQYLISSAAPDAPEFANGLFIASCNVGTTIGSAVGGALIAGMGIGHVVWVGVVALALGLMTIMLRIVAMSSENRLAEQ